MTDPRDDGLPTSNLHETQIARHELADRLAGLAVKATPGPWTHYNEVFRAQFNKRRVTEIQRANGQAIVNWSGFDGLPTATARKANANAALMVELVNNLLTILTALRTPASAPDREVDDLVKRLLDDAKHGYGAAMDWSDEECADYWARMCGKARKNASEAAAELERLTAEIDRLRGALAAINERTDGDYEFMGTDIREIARAALGDHEPPAG